MNDELLHAYRKDPRPEFAERLHNRINRPVIDESPKPAAAFLARWKPVLAAATVVAGLAVALTVPSVRAVAQDFLDLFRVKKFAAVSISADRMGQLRDGKVDLQTLLGDAVDEIKRPGEPREVASAELAASETGMSVLVPTYVYNVNDAPTIRVMDSASMRVRADAERLRESSTCSESRTPRFRQDSTERLSGCGYPRPSRWSIDAKEKPGSPR
ncbi:MAG: hypothetical protein IPF82_13740 [Blastocatellia bacterium]|nr:hypothetical protein [Blastocatellia bacterium]